MSDSIENILMNLVRDSNNIIASNTKTIANNNEEIKNLRGENEKLREELSYFRDKLNAFMNSSIESNSRLHERMDVLTNSVSSKTVKKSKIPVEPRIQCSFITKKGEQCKNSAFPGKNTCQKHVNYTIPRPVASTSKTKPDVKKPQLKKKKNPPMHNHAIGEAPPGGFCKLCETHGDIFDPETPDLEFEDVAVGDKYLEERLRAMLESDYE